MKNTTKTQKITSHNHIKNLKLNKNKYTIQSTTNLIKQKLTHKISNQTLFIPKISYITNNKIIQNF